MSFCNVNINMNINIYYEFWYYENGGLKRGRGYGKSKFRGIDGIMGPSDGGKRPRIWTADCSGIARIWVDVLSEDGPLSFMDFRIAYWVNDMELHLHVHRELMYSRGSVGFH
jgi:hypothetical protein